MGIAHHNVTLMARRTMVGGAHPTNFRAADFPGAPGREHTQAVASSKLVTSRGLKPAARIEVMFTKHALERRARQAHAVKYIRADALYVDVSRSW